MAGNALTVGLALLLLGLGWLLRAPLHWLPLERDEGAYALIAQRWLAGDALYRDLFDHKPPLVYLAFGLALALPADSVAAVRTVATLTLLATGATLLALGWRLYGRVAGLAALALLLAYGSSLRFQGLTFNSEAVLVLPATLGALLAVLALRAGSPALLGAAGFAVGLAICAKPVGVALLPPLLLAALLLPHRRRLGALLGLVGALLPGLAFALLLWRQGALVAARQALLDYNRLYVAESVALGWDPAWLWRIQAPMLLLALPAGAGLLVALRQTQAPRWRVVAQPVLALWGLALLASALLSLRAYPHYYLAAVPMLCLWAGAGLAALHRAARPLRLGVVAAPLLLAALLAPPLREVWPLRAQTPAQQAAALYGRDGALFFAAAGDAAAYAAARVPPEQPIFVWAAEPQIYYLARRRPASRFVYDYPVDRLPGAREELLARLRHDPPPLIITYHGVRPLGSHPFLDDYGYSLRATIGGFDLFER
ncbi:MAG TPA: glycosyltransferase family 39 protein [Roseiflexaceae bacterium]|nr:glycosyltransferase family 39 protein [Roseiflexaceae bacterium]